MCDAKCCGHNHGELCSCAPIQNGDPFQMAVHLASHMTDVDWYLTYRDLEHISHHRLCLIGKCAKCGGRLCVEQKPFDYASVDDFLAALYRHLYQFHQNMGQPLCHEVFREKFVKMFHENDRAMVQVWLGRAGNSLIHSDRFNDAPKVYTIVHTCADADQGCFPPPIGVASFNKVEAARTELERLVAEEKEIMKIPFSKKLYREEAGDDFWEAYRDGYAAGWFTRYEIIESLFHTNNEEEQTKWN